MSNPEVQQLNAVMQALLGHLQAGGVGGSGGGSGGGGSKEVLFGKGLEMMDRFSGGDTGWNEWSGDFRTMVQTKSEAAGEALIYIRVAGKAEKEVMSWKEVAESIKGRCAKGG